MLVQITQVATKSIGKRVKVSQLLLGAKVEPLYLGYKEVRRSSDASSSPHGWVHGELSVFDLLT